MKNEILKNELLFFDQANSSSDLSQKLILQLPIVPCLLHHLSNFTLANLFNTIRSQVTTSSGYTKPYAKASQSNLLGSYMHIIILYASNTLFIKKLSL